MVKTVPVSENRTSRITIQKKFKDKGILFFALSMALHLVFAFLIQSMPLPMVKQSFKEPIELEWITSGLQPQTPEEATLNVAPSSSQVLQQPNSVSELGQQTDEPGNVNIDTPHDLPAWAHRMLTQQQQGSQQDSLHARLDPRHLQTDLILDNQGPRVYERVGTDLPLQAQSGRTTQGRLRDEAYAAAQAKTHVQRTELQLRRLRDGSYEYSGARFRATISPDGEVRFAEGANVQVDSPTFGPGAVGIGGNFDLTDGIESSRGRDPHRAERTWFLRETEELRAKLETEGRLRAQDRAVRRLVARLEGLLKDPVLSADEKKKAVFDAWKDSSDDELGIEVREAILKLVRETMPRGTGGFSSSDLRWFNERAAYPFRPY